ncbi:MAG: sulfotransferase [Gammaproteobacteria bacterium]|nr:sulfotransferase [Gammaproteobacteria bacterium]
MQLIVEKTCANSLRVDFVDAVLGGARYIFIRRNGIDVVGSALNRWRGRLDVSYIARKARYVPLTDLPYYSARYLWSRVYRLVSSENRLALWGPQLADTHELLRKYPLEAVCAIQWKRCVDLAADALAGKPQERVIEVAYEDFVSAPTSELTRILEFLGSSFPLEVIEDCVADVASVNVGKGRRVLVAQQIDDIMPLMRDTMERYGYV